MNKIYIGNLNIANGKVYLGSSSVAKIFLGDNLVYPISDAVAVTLYDDSGNTFTVNCDDLQVPNRLTYGDITGASGYTSAEVGDCVTTIGAGGFGSDNPLTSVTLSDSVTTLELDSLTGWGTLLSVECGTGLTTVDGYALEGNTTIQEITFKGSVPPSFNSNWEESSNKTFTIYVPCTAIELYRTALSGKTSNLDARLQCIVENNKWSLTFANGDVRSLECDASGDSFPRQIDDHDWIAPLTPFDATHTKSGVTSAVVGDCVTGLLNGSFDNFTSLSSITVDSDSIYVYGGYSGMTPTGYGPFYNDSALTEFPYSSVLESIGRDSFHGCSGLTDATIASSCTWIGDEAFFGCTGLEKVVMEGSTPPVLGGDFVFYKIDSNAPSGVSQLDIDIEVPCDAVNAYKTAPRWSAYADRITCKTTPYSGQYLTFVALESGTFKFSGNSIDYSIDSGNTWTTLASNTDSPTVASGDTIMWKASGLIPTSNGIGRFSSTGEFYVQGNVMSLVYGDNFSGQTTIQNNQFTSLFSGATHITSAENLILPATTLTNVCYEGMFSNCTSLTVAPELPATTLANFCYRGMFYQCTSLNYIKCLATDISARNCTVNWVSNVAASGTFVKDASMDFWTTGNNGIPTGWTVQNDDGFGDSPLDPGDDWGDQD